MASEYIVANASCILGTDMQGLMPLQTAVTTPYLHKKELGPRLANQVIHYYLPFTVDNQLS